MNIIETVKKMLTEYPKIVEFTNDIHIDFTENVPTNFGLHSEGDALVKEDILGNQIRKHSFVLYAVNQAFEDYDRLANSTFLLELTYWLEKQKGQAVTVTIGDTEKQGKITIMSAANAMLYQIPTGNINDGVTYQIQIYANYSVAESED